MYKAELREEYLDLHGSGDLLFNDPEEPPLVPVDIPFVQRTRISTRFSAQNSRLPSSPRYHLGDR